MLSYLAPPLFTEDGVATLSQIQEELIKLQMTHGEHEIIVTLIQLLSVVKNAKASILADKNTSEHIAMLMAKLDKKTGACVPVVVDEASHQAADLILKSCDCFRLNSQQQKISGVHPKLLGVTNIFVKYNINTVISAIVGSYEVEKRIYETSKRYHTENVQHHVHKLMGHFHKKPAFFEQSAQPLDSCDDYQLLASEFLKAATEFGNLSVAYTKGGTVLARGQTDAYRKALMAENASIAKGRISSDVRPIYQAVKAIIMEERINAYNQECDDLILAFKSSLTAYLKTKPEQSKTKLANNLLYFIENVHVHSPSAFAKINELQSHLISHISTVTLGRLYEMMIEMRAKAILQLEKCDAACDSMLFDELKKYERLMQESSVTQLKDSDICCPVSSL